MSHSRQSRRTFLGGMGAAGLSPAWAATIPSAAAAAKQPAQTASPRLKEYIEGAKRAILDELNPTRSQLERGLELHRNSVVCDLYGGANANHLWGFYSERMKRWALEQLEHEQDPDRKEKLLRSVRAQLQKWRALEAVQDAQVRANHRFAWDASGIDLGLNDIAWAPEGEDDRFAIEQISRGAYIFDHYEHVEKFLHMGDVSRWKKEAKHGIVWHIGRPDACFAGPHVNDPIKNLDLFYGFGVRHCQLTNSTKNQVGCSHNQEVDTGLTDVGRVVVKRMNELGIIIDLSHSGYTTVLDAIKASDDPVVISHTACRSLAEGGKSKYRNATDEAIKGVADKGGMIGIITVPNLLGGYGTQTFYEHLNYAVKLVGVDHVGIGSDQGAMGRSVEPPELVAIQKPRKFRSSGLKGTKAYWKWETEPNSLSWTNAPYLTVGLVVRGYSDDDIRKIIGGNYMRVAHTIVNKRPRGALI